jgi:hypothetical protein
MTGGLLLVDKRDGALVRDIIEALSNTELHTADILHFGHDGLDDEGSERASQSRCSYRPSRRQWADS